MIPGYHDHEKFVQFHQQNLMKEAEHERRLALLPQSDRSSVRYLLTRPRIFLQSIRMRLREQAKRRKQLRKRAAR